MCTASPRCDVEYGDWSVVDEVDQVVRWVDGGCGSPMPYAPPLERRVGVVDL